MTTPVWIRACRGDGFTGVVAERRAVEGWAGRRGGQIREGEGGVDGGT
jgi:hypothetical protein